MRSVLVAVLSLILWTAVRGQTVYEPDRNDPNATYEVSVHDRCLETLEHPSDTTVHLFQYNISKFGISFVLQSTNVTNTDHHTEDCADSVPDPSNLTGNIRPTMFILESLTCHDVLFYNGSDPVVCLYQLGPSITINRPPAITTLVLASLSVVASVLLLVTHIIFPSLRTLPSKVIMNLALSFLLGDICVIVQTSMALEIEEFETLDFEIVAVVSFYFFFARFVWMALAGFEMCRTIHVGTQLRFDSEKKRLRIFIGYLLFGWLVPLIPTIIMAVVHFEDLENKDYGEGSLFGIGGYIITLLPVGVVIIFNLGIAVYLTYVLYMAHQWQVKVSSAIMAHKRQTKFARIFLIIISILGFLWILTFLLFIDGVSNFVGIQVFVSILNTSQPIFVCIAFVFTKKIALKYLSLCSGAPEEDDTLTTTSNDKFRRFRNRRLLSYLFTDRELAAALPKYRFKRQQRNNSKISTTSVTMLSRDSCNSIDAQTPRANGSCSPPNGLTPITEEQEPDQTVDESPPHTAVDVKDSEL